MKNLSPDGKVEKKEFSTIVLLNHHLKEFGGSELVTYDLAVFFKSKGWEVTVATFQYGEPLRRLFNEKSIRVYDLLHEQLPVKVFDVMWAHHFPIVTKCLVSDHIKVRRLILSTLSPYEPLEALPLFAREADVILVNSHENYYEVLNANQMLGCDVSSIMVFPNSASDAWLSFSDSREINEAGGTAKPRKLAIVSNHPPQEVLDAIAMFEKAGIAVQLFGLLGTYTFVSPGILSQFDAVITIGRTVQQAMAIGVPVFCYDRFGGPGWITSDNYEKAEWYNYSGRCTNIKLTSNEIVSRVLEGYPFALRHTNYFRELARSRYNLGRNVEKVLKLIHKREGNTTDGLGWKLRDQKKYWHLSRQNQVYLMALKKLLGLSEIKNRSSWGGTSVRSSWQKVTTLSIIVPVNCNPVVTRKALESILKWHSNSSPNQLELIIVDNKSDCETKMFLEGFSENVFETLLQEIHIKTVHNEENLGYPLACNKGIALAKGEFIVVMNNDVVVTPHWASRMMAAFAVDSSIGIVGPRTNYCAGPQVVPECRYDESSLDSWAEKWYLQHAGSLREVSRLIGFLWMMKREVVDKIGGFDPIFGIGNYEDDDYCLRAHLAGFRLVIADDVFVHHYGSQSFRKIPETYTKLLETNRQLFTGKWGIDFAGGCYRPDEVVARFRGHVDKEILYIPLEFKEIFSPHVEPLNVGCAASFKILCVPDPSDSEKTWLQLVSEYLKAFKPAEGVALMVRVEPSTREWFLKVVSEIQEVARKEKLDLERNDLIIEARQIPSCHRGSVYRAADAFVVLPGVREQVLAREARACGLAVWKLPKPSAHALRLLVQEHSGKADARVRQK
ncbi:MAG: glycosyltransferase [Bacillota bacterium]|nr:glycosyltransferase [Bacillota bacterium]